MATNVVGARELKVRLGTYLRQVRQGRTLVVTDRGQPVAELRPMSSNAAEAVLVRLEADGVVMRPTQKGLVPFQPVHAGRAGLSTAVLEDRDDRF